MILDHLTEQMTARFGVSAGDVRIVRAPYRICPIGAHIDHQLGYVTAMAIDRATYLAYVPSNGPDVRLQSLAFDGEIHFSLRDIPDKRDGDWGNFPRGAARALQQAGHALSRGITGLTAGDLSEGGLSSSAAIGVAYLLSLEDANALSIAPEENIRLDQAIENGYLGLKNGILDQSAILLSRKNHLTLIDCARGNHELLPKPASMPPFDILIAFSGVRQALVATGYNARVEECAAAARTLLLALGRPNENPVLRAIAPVEYHAHKRRLRGAPAKRARHFFTEFDRIYHGIQAWRAGDLKTFGRLIAESGKSSIENYECGSPPLIDLYHILIETDGIYGARFSGAGFRGCCVALADPEKSASAVEHIRSTYAANHPDLAPNAPVFTCQPDDGARIL